ncbi:MAG: tetratricopeptide repeat protein [Alphaproteobacteria bacterium]
MKTIATILASCVVGFCANQEPPTMPFQLAKAGGTDIPVTSSAPPSATLPKDVQAGEYLASRFAQIHHDWKQADAFLTPIIEAGQHSKALLQRSIVLAVGSGNTPSAINTAKKFHELYPDERNSIAQILLISEAFKTEDYNKAQELYKSLRVDRTTKFVSPFIEGWIKAGNGQLKIKNLKSNTVQLYHAILISDFLKDHSAIEKIVSRAIKVEGIDVSELERIADLYGHIGLNEKALELYKTIEKQTSDHTSIQNKIANLSSGKNQPLFKKVTTARHGMAKAFHDIAGILHAENNDESARVFAHIALYLEPDTVGTALLLGQINTAHKQYDDAISYYKSIPQSNENYLDAQHKIVNIYEDTKEYGKAYKHLKALYKTHESVETIIRMGDLYRHQEKYKEAMTFYEKAIAEMNGDVPPEYWYLHYVRGIAYEQTGNWGKAEADLKTALKFQPDHPYVLNYLGYAWADRGENLQAAMDMIRRAVDLRPSDGYITDSLGWVMYKVRDYTNAVPVLERAVELRPYDPTINDHLGDAYWKVGRTMEAQFQWSRAKNHSEDDEQIQTIDKKLISGIPADKIEH